MARSPLFGYLQQIVRDYTVAQEVGISVQDAQQRRLEATEARRATGLTRRDLLARAGVLAAGATVAAPLIRAELAHATDIAGQGKPRIAIIGAGISGLAAALTLADAGVASTVYEASGRVGGRMHSDNQSYWADGQVSEWCGELIDSGHTAIQDLAARFNLPLADLRAAQPANSTDTLYFLGQYYPYSQAVADFGPVYQVLTAQSNAAGYPTLYNSYTRAGWLLDNTSIYDWIERYVPGGHRAPLGQFLDVAYTIEYGADSRVSSSLNLLYLLSSQPTTPGLSIFGVSDERYHIVGGNQLLPQAIAASLPQGAVRMGWRLRRIAAEGGQLLLTFGVGDEAVPVTVDRLILALPFSVLRTLDIADAGFDARKLATISGLGHSVNAKLQLQFDARPWNGAGPWGAASTGGIFTDLGFQSTWDVTRAQPGQHGIIVDYTGGWPAAALSASTPYATSDQPAVAAQARAFLGQLETVWPGVSAHYTGRATLSTPATDPNLRCAYSVWLRGQYTRFAGYERVAQGHTHFAGEQSSIDYQGFMEGSAREGQRAAQEVLGALGLPASPGRATVKR